MPYPYILSLPVENTISAGFFVWALIIIFGIKLVYKKICYAL